MIGGWVLDADSLTGFAAGRSVYAQALVWTAVEEGMVLVVPAAALARCVAALDEFARSALDVLLGLPVTVVDDMAGAQAEEVGQLLAAARTDDVALGHAVRCARQRGWPLLAGDGARARQLDSTIDVRELP